MLSQRPRCLLVTRDDVVSDGPRMARASLACGVGRRVEDFIPSCPNGLTDPELRILIEAYLLVGAVGTQNDPPALRPKFHTFFHGVYDVGLCMNPACLQVPRRSSRPIRLSLERDRLPLQRSEPARLLCDGQWRATRDWNPRTKPCHWLLCRQLQRQASCE